MSNRCGGFLEISQVFLKPIRFISIRSVRRSIGLAKFDHRFLWNCLSVSETYRILLKPIGSTIMNVSFYRIGEHEHALYIGSANMNMRFISDRRNMNMRFSSVWRMWTCAFHRFDVCEHAVLCCRFQIFFIGFRLSRSDAFFLSKCFWIHRFGGGIWHDSSKCFESLGSDSSRWIRSIISLFFSLSVSKPISPSDSLTLCGIIHNGDDEILTTRGLCL